MFSARLVVADSIIQGKRGRGGGGGGGRRGGGGRVGRGGGGGGRGGRELYSFLLAGENVIMHQSVWLLAQNPATRPRREVRKP